jgi:hypothetical protein
MRRKTQQPKPFKITPELEAWLLEVADKPVSPLTAADFIGIRERMRTRVESAAAPKNTPSGID